MEKRNLTCIVCPMGCALETVIENGQVVSVTGNTCPRGAAYAKSECVHPTRVLTTTLRVNGGEKPLVSAKSAGAIPKELLFRAMEEINAARAEAPVEMGQVLLPDLCGTGVPLVATGEVGKETNGDK